MSDIRDSAGACPMGWNEDHRSMTLVDPDGKAWPAEYEVCEVCGGQGTHVNPNIDRDGISPEKFAEDPDFEKDYHSGVHDVQCVACKGRRVVLTPSSDNGKIAFRDAWDSDSAYFAEMESERRMGA